jgi:uncharacterized membrane protein
MKKQITSISPLQTAKVIAVLYFIVSLPFLPLLALTMLGSGGQQHASPAFLLILPFLYAVIGFVVTAFCAWVYNIVAKQVGGIEFTTSEAPAA